MGMLDEDCRMGFLETWLAVGSGADDGDGDEVQDTQESSFISFLTLFLPLIPY